MTSAPGSVRVKSTQKHFSKMPTDLNVNDLLNFTLPPRQQRPIASTPRRSRRTGTSQAVWNKERFVNAQYRFVMNPTGDYTAHFADPDIFFQWHDILQVIIPRTSVLFTATDVESPVQDNFMSCPICLSSPTASRITKCGHIFCYPCILHYLNTTENKWARCPICFDSVNERQLKSVKLFDRNEDKFNIRVSASSLSDAIFESPRIGASLKMRLIQRPQITTLALPRSPTWPSDLLPPHQTPFHFLPDVYNFAKFMLATPDYLIGNLNSDLDELAAERRVLESINDSLGIVFIDSAETKVREQIAKASALDTSILKGEIEKTRREQEEINERSSFYARGIILEDAGDEEVPHEYTELSSRCASTTISGTGSLRPQPRNHPRQRRNLNPPPPSTSSYYFYQAASGLPLYLHPLDIRILLSHFHSYSSFPDSITVHVECVSLCSVNDDLRKRCKYLAHMPEGTDVAFIESDLEGVIGSEGLKNFEVPLRMRTAKRKEKERKEEKAKFKAEEREKSKLNVGLSEWVGSTSKGIAGGYPREMMEQSSSEAPIPTPVSSATSSSAGVWGLRSFASALHSSSTPTGASALQRRSSSLTVDDEWDIDVAWHELEQRNVGGRRQRAKKLVILGSGGAGARRR